VNLSSRLETLPVEDWAAAVARVVRRARRRVMRKPARSVGAVVAVAVIAAIGTNALFEQQGEHPAPIWGGSDVAEEGGTRLVAAHSPPGRTPDARTAPEAPDALVIQVQGALVEAGYFGGEVDGILSQETREAIQVFEVENGLPVTGEPSLALISAFGELEAVAGRAEGQDSTVEVASVAVAEEAPLPQRPTAIDSVSEIQAALNKVGLGPLTVDGVMGPRTRAALDEFAASRQLDAKGVTPAVLRALAEEAR